MNVKWDGLLKRLGQEIDAAMKPGRAQPGSPYFGNSHGWHPVDVRWQRTPGGQAAPSLGRLRWDHRKRTTWWSMARSV